MPNGGPDGGDGGKGGDIIFEVDPGLNTLTDFRHSAEICGTRGKKAERSAVTGKCSDPGVKVPEGTVIKDSESGKVIADMSGENKRRRSV